ncbi:S41 family peptidase [Eubacterium xylanophilum]|uniref:S41 family peptidase n=1 Tax=Eubacterium xylanophilum TaxID=39497 RepID=UPI0004B73E10|nr:S41 family peptidase [Eubacterium xylanophilum]
MRFKAFLKKYKDYLIGVFTGITFCVAVYVILLMFGIFPFEGKVVGGIHNKTRIISDCIEKYYQGEYDEQKLIDGAASGMVDALGDKYSCYYSKSEYKDKKDQINGQYVGIGVTMQQKDNERIKVVSVNENGPAAKAGMQVGDVILKLDGVDYTSKKIKDLTDVIKNDKNKNKTFVITVERTGEDGKAQNIDIKVVTDTVKVVSVASEMIDGYGYIRIATFDNETDDQFKKKVDDLEKQGAKGLLIDLRDNGGGIVDSAINMLNRLLPKGKLITEKSKRGEDVEYTSDDEQKYDKPIVVLVNGNSASASEIFAGSLRDRAGVKLVGTKTYGKGVVQSVISLEDSCGGGLKLTTSEYFLPNGETIHKKGLTPDIVEEYKKQSEGAYSKDQDSVLQKGLEVLKAQ